MLPAFLLDRGWKVAPSSTLRGTAACDFANRRILVTPKALARPSRRVRRYVIPHEVAHAIHAELGQPMGGIPAARGLDRASALEVVADRAVLDGTAEMRCWVRGSIVWHNRHGYRYGWDDVMSAEAGAVVALLRAAA